jgi:hypothetical protein
MAAAVQRAAGDAEHESDSALAAYAIQPPPPSGDVGAVAGHLSRPVAADSAVVLDLAAVPKDMDRPVTETEGSPTFTTSVDAIQVEITECKCPCNTCGELVDDGAICLLCRVNVHDGSDE